MVSSGAVLIGSLAGLAVVLGTLTAALFTFSRAANIAAIAQSGLAKGAAIPLTGFFQTSMELGFAATSPIKTFSDRSDAFLSDFQFAWKKTLGAISTRIAKVVIKSDNCHERSCSS